MAWSRTWRSLPRRSIARPAPPWSGSRRAGSGRPADGEPEVITLFTFGPYFGLPDGSPFVTKAMLLLKFAGLAYREDRSGYGKAPKGKLPFIDDDGVIVAD